MMTQFSPADLEENIDENVFFMEILYKLENTEYIFCVEGVDDKPFYSSYFNRFYSQKKWELLDCEGRKKVEQLFNLLKKAPDFETRFKSVLFFVDRDLNPPPSHERLFVTCGYSFENYLCNIQTVYRTLQELNREIKENKIKRQFDKYTQSFVQIYSPIMSFLKEKRNYFDNYNPIGLFHNVKWEKKERAVKLLNKIDASFQDTNTSLWDLNDIRGKYVCEFLILFIREHLTDEGDKNNHKLIKKTLISYVQPIPALDDYFKRHIKEAS
jgi:hypothetical protein